MKEDSPSKREDQLESPGKRNLRPRKIENYQQMLEDEVTLKTIKDEELEKKRILLKAGLLDNGTAGKITVVPELDAGQIDYDMYEGGGVAT